MNWKTRIRVSDLAPTQKLEIICRRCGRLAYITGVDVTDQSLYLDELERRLRCKARGCRGHARLAMVRLDELTGFVGGLA